MNASSQITISDNAAQHIAMLLKQEKSTAALMLRITVSGGGCSGFQYGFTFDDVRRADDHTFEKKGVTVVIDEVSLQLLNLAEIDYVEDLVGASFVIRNPNAASSCGCGNSFSL